MFKHNDIIQRATALCDILCCGCKNPNSCDSMDYCKAVKSLRDVIGVHNQNLIDDERLILNQAECISKLKEELIQIKTAYAKSLQSNAYMFDQNKHYRALIDSQLRGQDELRRENSTLRTKLEENNIKKRSSK